MVESFNFDLESSISIFKQLIYIVYVNGIMLTNILKLVLNE